MAYSIDLSGRVAFVTGASSGLGAQFAKTLARAGAAVVLASRRVEKLKELRARIEGEGGDAHVVELDVTDHGSIKAAVARADGSAPGTYIGGRIINIASVAALRVVPNLGAYCMSKSAVVQMTKAMALEWGRFGINVNALCPGYIATELNEDVWTTEAGAKLVSILPRKRVGKPEDLDGLIVLLASGQSHFVNGAVIAADDGFAL